MINHTIACKSLFPGMDCSSLDNFFCWRLGIFHETTLSRLWSSSPHCSTDIFNYICFIMHNVWTHHFWNTWNTRCKVRFFWVFPLLTWFFVTNDFQFIQLSLCLLECSALHYVGICDCHNTVLYRILCSVKYSFW